MQTKGKDFYDWPAIRQEYEAGGRSNRYLAKRFGVSDVAIGKRAKAEGWCKPGQRPAQASAGELVPVSPALRIEEPAAASSKTLEEIAQSDPEEIRQLGLRVIHRHLAELDAIEEHLGEIEDVIWDETRGDKDSKRRNAMLRAISHPVRAQAAKALMSALQTAQTTPATAQPKGGKKAEAQKAAQSAGKGTNWGDDLEVAGAFN